jgi:paraquat-inducible protein B
MYGTAPAISVAPEGLVAGGSRRRGPRTLGATPYLAAEDRAQMAPVSGIGLISGSIIDVNCAPNTRMVCDVGPAAIWVHGEGQMGRSLTPRVRAVSVIACLCASFASGASAQVAPIVDGVPFLIRFHGSVRGLAPGAPVEVQGNRIGEVTSVGVEYSPDSNSFVAPVGIVLQPSLFPAAGARPRTAAEVYDAAGLLVQRGLRAQVSDTQLLGGKAIVALDIQPDAPPATLDRRGKVPELPAGPTQQERIAQKLQPLIAKLADAPIDQMFTQLQDAMAALNQLVTGPELRGALEELRGASADLRNVVDGLGARSDTLIANLTETVRSTNRLIDHTGQTLATIDRQVGDRSPLLADIRGLVQQLDGAARSMRLMGEYLERNPNALITGKSDNRR